MSLSKYQETKLETEKFVKALDAEIAHLDDLMKSPKKMTVITIKTATTEKAVDMEMKIIKESGLLLLKFNGLHKEFKINRSYNAFEQKRLSRGDRQRKIGAGHPFKLPLTDRLLMLLVYYRLYVSSTLAAYLFDLGQTNVLKDIRMLEPLVSEVLPLPKRLHQKVKRLRTFDEVEGAFKGSKAFLDATEQEIPRPKKKLKRKTNYSGKKKKHQDT